MTPTEKALWVFVAVQASAIIWLLFERVRTLKHISTLASCMEKWMISQRTINYTMDKDLARINKHIFK